MATPAAAPAAPAPSTSAFSPTSAAALNRSAGGVVGPPVAPPSLTVALDEGELNPEALVNLLEDPSLTEKKSKKYALKIKDLNKKYAVRRHATCTPWTHARCCSLFDRRSDASPPSLSRWRSSCVVCW